MTKRFFVQLAHKYEMQNVGGWYMSEKLDGMRAYWDGGVSREVPCLEVPWANTLKDHIRKKPPIATGLWTRRGKMIPAPDWWLDELPQFPLDGELYLGPGRFQEVMSTCKGSDRDWSDVMFPIFGMPPLKTQFAEGEMCFNSTQKIILLHPCINFFKERMDCSIFERSYEGMRLARMPLSYGEIWYTLEQTRLPKVDYEDIIDEAMVEVMRKGGEGLMLAHPTAMWEPYRTHNLLKVKTFNEGEGIVLGYTWGRKTDKGSKLANLMGQLRVKFNGHEFGLSGFREEERVLHHNHTKKPTKMCHWFPGCKCHKYIYSEQFPIGSEVRFKYRELTDDGKPKEARYWR